MGKLNGLSTSEVEDRRAKGLINTDIESTSKTVKQIIISNLCTYFNLIFTVLALLILAVGSFRDLTFIPVVACNTIIGIIQEIRSKKVLDKINILNAPKAKAIRNGEEIIINSNELVQDDLVVFAAGNQICADAVVISGNAQVNEALLTGEADEINKTEGCELMSGSFVVSGSCVAKLTRVGKESYISKLTMEAKSMSVKHQSEMIRSLDVLVKAIGLAIIPIGILLYVQNHYWIGNSVTDSVVAMVAALVGMIPEGLYLLTSIALVVSIMRLATSKVLVHEMSCIETLARVNVLCVDKTGTITDNEMHVSGYDIVSSKYDEKSISTMLGDFVNNMSKDNITMAAMMEKFGENSGKKAISVTGFSSKLKYSSVTYDDGVYVLGAPEFVMRDQLSECKEKIEKYSGEGNRVLVFAKYDGVIEGKALENRVEALALVMLNNPIRKEAPETFRYFAEQGVEIKVISGDNPITVSRVAIEAGIAGAEKYVDASTLTSDELIRDAMQKYTVFGRVTPEQKRLFVKALKSLGKTVAMTGDGVNDVLALKDADCSVAMASGSEAAANAAQIVLLDSNFACMPSVVLEGRRVVNNIQRSASLFLIKNIFSILTTILVIFAGKTYPLKPTQLSLIGAFVIGVPAFFLALQPNKSIIKGHFMTNVLLKAAPAGITNFITVAILLFTSDIIPGINPEHVSTMAITIMIVVGMAALVRICYPFNLFRVLICIAMTLGIVISYLFFGRLFALEHLTGDEGLILAIFCVASLAVYIFMIEIIRIVEKRIIK